MSDVRGLGSLCLTLALSVSLHVPAPAREPGGEGEPSIIGLKSDDGIDISFRLRPAAEGGRRDRLIVISPGYVQHSGTSNMLLLAGDCASLGDCACLDYRGNGLSGGKYTFGAEEYRDLEALLLWGRPRYAELAVLGFSLGAYTALREAARRPDLVDRLILVSCPTRLEEIVSSGGAFLNPLALMFQRGYRIKPEKDLSYRSGPIFGGDKPDAADLAPALKVKPEFLTGGKDALVFPRLSRRVFMASPHGSGWSFWPNGYHAERMYLQEPEAFMAWLQKALDGGLAAERRD